MVSFPSSLRFCHIVIASLSIGRAKVCLSVSVPAAQKVVDCARDCAAAKIAPAQNKNVPATVRAWTSKSA